MPANKQEDAVKAVIEKTRTAVRNRVATEQLIMKEIQKNLEGRGMSSKDAKEKAVDIYESLKEKQSNQSAEQ